MEGYFRGRVAPRPAPPADHEIFHLTLLSETTKGLREPHSRSPRAYLDGSLPARLDFELLETHREGLIATSGCLGGLVCQRLLQGDVRAPPRPRPLPGILARNNFLVELPGPRPPEQHQTNPS